METIAASSAITPIKEYLGLDEAYGMARFDPAFVMDREEFAKWYGDGRTLLYY